MQVWTGLDEQFGRQCQAEALAVNGGAILRGKQWNGKLKSIPAVQTPPPGRSPVIRQDQPIG